MHTILLYSGGLDSTVLLYDLRSRGREVTCLSVDYGQRHRRELDAAREICAGLGVPHLVVAAPREVFRGSALTGGGDVPHGHYEEESMKQTVVPGRNLFLLSMAVSYAISVKADSVAYAAHGGDHAIYPDCRAGFVRSLNETVALCDWHRVEVEAPFLTMDKRAIARLGKALGVPFERTWTCYEGGASPCGKCGSCVERREALEES